ncbi:MAG TPA: Hansenula MRAKII killer toxin-resistant protein 1 [Actinoplanes sp.]|nr:Hansenula MRAKII killer toxin-resistant protein 1 [Actinoplanes sp.]
MAEKGLTTQAGIAAGIAAGAGAAQLGLGYGLGVIAWPVTAAEPASTWLGSLGWAAWITASATVFGAVIAGRMRSEIPSRWRALWRFALSLASTLGGLVSLILVALPARSAVRDGTLSPQLVAGGYALAGLVVGLIVAFWAVSSGPVAANLIGTALWLWALAIAAVIAELVTGRDFATYLTSWQFTESVNPVSYGGIYWPSALMTLAAAFAIGLIAAGPAVLRNDVGLGTAISGAVGPLLVAFSFLALAPQLTETLGPLQSAYLIAPYAVLAGLGGSALIVALAKSRPSRREPKDAVEQKALPAPEKDAPETSVPERDVPEKSTPVKAAPVKAAPVKVAPEKAVPEKAAPERSGTPRPMNAPPAAPKPINPPPTAPKPVPTAPRTPVKRKNGEPAPRSTITPPPAKPTVARINPDDSTK